MGLLVSALSVASIHAVSAATLFDDNQVAIENRPENGSLHIISDDSLEIEVVDPPSMLTLAANTSSTGFCTSAESQVCNGNDNLWYAAHLPQCGSGITTDCIASVSATTANGEQRPGTFNRYFPNQGPQSYNGKSSILLPTGRAPSIWKIPGAPHESGDEYAVVARLRGSTSRRKAASFQLSITPVSLKTNADPSPNYQLPAWTEPGRLGGPVADRGLFRCAYWGENGSCMLSRNFPKDILFNVTVRLAAEPSGWLHGRIDSPDISFTKDGTETIVSVTASPVQVPSFQIGQQFANFPINVQEAFAVNGPYGPGGSRQPGGAQRTDSAMRNAEYVIAASNDQSFEQLELLTPVIGDKAGWAPSLWRVRTLSDGEMSKAGSCLTTGDGVKGIVTTNATVYGSGPPAYNSTTKSLDYKVAAPHFTRTDDVFQGAYHLIVRSDVARCFYGFTSEPITGDISVVEAAGTTGSATTSIREENGWLKVSAVGFAHSAPVIRTILRQTKFVPKLTTKAKRNISGATLARTAKMSVPKKAKISVSIASKYAKKCRVSGTSVRALAKGTCVVRVTVTTASKKRTVKNVTINVK